jgi:hypothetical protein
MIPLAGAGRETSGTRWENPGWQNAERESVSTLGNGRF